MDAGITGWIITALCIVLVGSTALQQCTARESDKVWADQLDKTRELCAGPKPKVETETKTITVVKEDKDGE